MGFGNLALGSIGLLQRRRNRLETMAMLTDLFAAVMLFGGCLAVAATGAA